VAARLGEGFREPRTVTGLRPLLGYLGELGLLPAEPPEPLDAAGTLHPPPTRPLTPHAVSNIVRRGGIRAGLEPFGPHRLRHTAACAMIGAKVPLAGIAQVMRHRDQVVTAVYARADLDRLRPLARPWPTAPALPEGGAS
jgi:integrase